MKKIVLSIVIIVLLFSNLATVKAQYWGSSDPSCNKNANVSDLWASGRENIIDATFKMDPYGNCTGTLINRNTSDGNLGFYTNWKYSLI